MGRRDVVVGARFELGAAFLVAVSALIRVGPRTAIIIVAVEQLIVLVVVESGGSLRGM